MERISICIPTTAKVHLELTTQEPERPNQEKGKSTEAESSKARLEAALWAQRRRNRKRLQ
jgi:hypothetical protein